MSVFDSVDSVDIVFVKDLSRIEVEYAGEFSPLHLVKLIRAELLAVSAHSESRSANGTI